MKTHKPLSQNDIIYCFHSNGCKIHLVAIVEGKAKSLNVCMSKYVKIQWEIEQDNASTHSFAGILYGLKLHSNISRASVLGIRPLRSFLPHCYLSNLAESL